MNTEIEINALKQEVARLRREMDEYRQFIRYNPASRTDDDQPEAAYITIRCAIFQLAHPSDSSRSQVNIMGGPNGGFVSVMGKDEKSRIVMNVENDEPSLSLMGKDNQYKASLRLEQGEPWFELYGNEGKVGVQLRVVGEAGRGQVGVCESGKARAVMKATELGGVLSAVHDDGHPRITMNSTESNGELCAVTPDMKIGVRIAADGMDGGYITINRANGNAGVILSNTPLGGTVIVLDQQNNITGHLPMIPEE